MKNGKFCSILVIPLAVGLCLNVSGCTSPWRDETVLVPEKGIDFVPETGNSYDIEWPGPPRETLSYSHVKFYIPQLELSTPASTSYAQRFKIKAKRSWWRDKDIGEFEAVYDAGQTKPTAVRYASALQDAQPPANAPAETTSKFWLGCTKEGNVKGNIDKHANSTVVYLVEENRQLSANTIVLGRKSPERRISCVDIGTTGNGNGPHGACSLGQKCCGKIIGNECLGRCWPANQDCETNVR